ncbi:MAG TPA: DUF4340 domain-containing protein [Polyangiales bacterium]|jgi:hypothetical protein
MRAVIVHGLLAVFGLGFAYQTYSLKPEEESAPGSVTVAECSPEALQKITLTTPTNEIIVTPKRDHGESIYWIDNSQKSPTPQPPKPDDKPKEIPEASKPRHYIANGSFAEYLKRYAPLRALRSLGTLPKDKDADFGFDKVGTYVKLSCAGRTTEFEVGSRAFGASQRYFRDQKSKTTYLFEEQLVSDLESANFKFMQTDLHAFSNADVEEITVSAQGAKKRILHRDRKVPEQALWVDADAPAKRNELYGNWFTRLSKMRARVYLPDGADPGSDLKGATGGSEPVLTIDYKVEGKPNGKLELVRVDENGVAHYYARSETTRNWVAVYDSAAKEVEQDVGMVVGTEQAPSKPIGASASDKSNDKTGHGASLPPGHPAIPSAAHPH